jgi:SAM-dependent methyltransferase
MDCLSFPPSNPTNLFDLLRAGYASELLIASVAHLGIFEYLSPSSRTFAEVRDALGLSDRAANVLLTGLRAMALVDSDGSGKLRLSATARNHLTRGEPFYIGDYCALSAESASVLTLVERLKTSRPAEATSVGQGAAYIFRDGLDSAMEEERTARELTFALAGRARNVAPHLAASMPLSEHGVLLDVGAGSGVYSIAILQKNRGWRAILLERPEVLKVASELARQAGVADRMEFYPGDMFVAAFPKVDAVLLSNVLHDWDVTECRTLVERCAGALLPGGKLYVHDAFLNDDLAGPLEVALYSVALFTLTEGRAYSAAEMKAWLSEAGLVYESLHPTLVHCSVLIASKSTA